MFLQIFFGRSKLPFFASLTKEDVSVEAVDFFGILVSYCVWLFISFLMQDLLNGQDLNFSTGTKIRVNFHLRHATLVSSVIV